ncbi:MAG: type II secretion system F family protein [Acidimicrobiales bacterium]|jgi:tight adherence protein C
MIDAAFCALLGGSTVFWTATRLAHPRRSPIGRLSLYLEGARARLGGTPAVATGPLLAGEAFRRVLGPLVGGAVSRVAKVGRLGPAANLELSLRQAGVKLAPDAYRREYLRWLIGTPLVLGLIGALTGKASFVVLFFAAGVFVGARRLPERLKAQARRRSDRVRSDLPTVASMLALKIENNKSLVVAVSDVAAQGSGPVAEELGRAVHLINAGYGEAPAFELVAKESAEPAASRFYRFLAAATGGGLDLAKALLDQANELRAQRREEIERSSAQRQMALIIPNLVFMAPVLFAFLLAPLPQLLFGK